MLKNMGEIYKITNNITGKIYVGKTKRTTKDRWLEHIRDAKNYPFENIPLHKAIIKHGSENFIVEVLESGIDEKELNKKEKYYIKTLKSTNSNIGYNATSGGDGGAVSTKLSQEEVEQIISLLSDEINPISINKIAKKFNVTNTTIRAINDGKAWFNSSIIYPIRKYDVNRLGVDKVTYKNIVSDLLHSDLVVDEIAKTHNVYPSCVYEINQGRYCYNGKNPYYNTIYSGDFPIRRISNRVECDFNEAFYQVLFSNKSISQIERDFNIDFNGLRYIVLGKRRRELTKNYIVPMREHIEENKIIWNRINGGIRHEVCPNT